METKSDSNSYGFRKNRSTADAMSQIFVRMCKPGSAKWVLDADIEGFFDNINHEWMLNHIRMDQQVLRKWLKCGVVDRTGLLATTAGTPQGGIISPALANWTLNGLETELLRYCLNKWGTGKTKRLKIGVIRYADDFVITGDSEELLRDEIQPWVETFLSERGLRLAAAKTKVVHIDNGFDFLGWNFRKYSGKLLIKPSKKNVKAFYAELREVINKRLQVTQEELIRVLNPKLRGWAQYHHPVVAKRTFSFIESLLYWRLVRWAKRRHPMKNADWVRKKYWRPVGNRKWVFAVDASRKDGADSVLELYSLSSTRIARHVKVKGEYNPYDPKDEMYGETLLQRRMLAKRRDFKEWATLYLRQEGKCAHCGFELDDVTGSHIHHVERRVDGGSEALSNKRLVHPACHAQIHS